MPAVKPVYLDSNNDLSVMLTGDYVPIAHGGTGAVDAPGARTALGLEIGVAVAAWDADLDAIAALNSTGFAVRSAANTWVQRSITGPANGINVANGDGISGNPTISLSNDLAALEGLASTGFAARIGADSWAQRSVTGTAGRIGVTNGDGISGNPTVDLATLSDGGGGSLLKFTRDAYGRVSGTSAVAEGDLTSILNSVYVNVGGDIMTGYLTLHADPSSDMHAVTKQYADGLRNGQRAKASVRVVATSNVNTASPGATHDGVTLSNGEFILLVGQSTGHENGAYVFNGAASPLTRRDDYNTSAEVAGGDTFFVNEGTTWADSTWTLITDGAITLGTTNLVFTQTNALGQIVAGNGLIKTGNTLAVGTASTARIVVNADDIDLATVAGLTPGTYTKITVDAYGRATVGATATPADIGAQPADADLDAIAGLSSTGLVARTGAGTAAARVLQAPAAGISISNANGVSGDPTFSLVNDLAALEGLSTNGLAVRTGTDTWATRSVTGQAGRIAVTNGNGGGGDINVDLAGSVVTPGTYNSVTVDEYGRVVSGSTISSAVESTTTQLTNNQGSSVVIGRAIYSDGSNTFKLAQSDAVGTRKAGGLVAATSLNNGVAGDIVTAGVMTATTGQWDVVTGQTGGLTPDAYYYLSGTTAGGLTPTAPTTGWLVKIGKALSTTKMLVSFESPIRLT